MIEVNRIHRALHGADDVFVRSQRSFEIDKDSAASVLRAIVVGDTIRDWS